MKNKDVIIIVLTEKDLIANPHYTINNSFKVNETSFSYEPLKAITELDLQGKVDYDQSTRVIKVNIKIVTNTMIMDARILRIIPYPLVLDWNNEYSFEFSENSNINYLNENNFDIIKYAIDEIIMNIPINFSINNDTIISGDSSWQVISDQEFDEYQANKVDHPRWEELKQQYEQKNKEEK
ncbi:hypothetical protein P344_04270 [Spiroplasma mirum ATCC 29335]|uniref:DUF177 domain-containing protein n=1 Tax=Spiroplasma mirum ATCC 29335 TaxID=838561 RepID=W0GLM5_9MOLU|nr:MULTISPECIES: hypothetical protein [Spiroplasma]AHF61130.1 hypothetical protein SMM_0712 [Spiroplasma mirum ATCC 29335]AHI58180.1 hypothetical protein P344_04270 [Spiroplasma mirum ATCC 29335]AKM53230.1 hypothetical protein SATRI_v1c07790 [Spiroplasma atrichopogonis]